MKHLDFLKKSSIGLHFFIGIGGLAGGLGAVSNPNAPMGASTELLKMGHLKISSYQVYFS